MSNSIFEDAMLLAAGGIVGLIASEVLRDEDEDEEDYDDASKPLTTNGYIIESLLESLQKEAQEAIASCKTEDEQSAVRTSIQQSIQQLQNNLATRGAQVQEKSKTSAETNAFADLEDRTMPKKEESFSKQHVQNIQQLLSKLSETLNQSTDNPLPNAHPFAVSASCAS